MTDMTVSETLNKAADLIEERGWAVGEGWTVKPGAPLCVEGAIAAAEGRESGAGYSCPAYRAVRDYVGQAPWIWNDHLIFANGDVMVGWLGGSRESAFRLARAEVIATLRAAALIAESREASLEIVSEVPC